MITAFGKYHARINSGLLPCSFSQCMWRLEKILERNLVEIENIILWKTPEQNPWLLPFSVFELVVVVARGSGDAKNSNFEFSKIRVLNIGDTAPYLYLKSVSDANHKCFHLSIFWFTLVNSFRRDDASTAENNAADYCNKCEI